MEIKRQRPKDQKILGETENKRQDQLIRQRPKSWRPKRQGPRRRRPQKTETKKTESDQIFGQERLTEAEKLNKPEEERQG